MTGPAEQRLTDILGLTEAKPLADTLTRLRGRPVELDASGVERIGALCLQVLLSARRTWAEDGAPFSVVRASPAFLEQSARLGAVGLAG